MDEQFRKFTRLDEQGLVGTPVWLNPAHIVAVVGRSTATAVRVLTVAGVEYRVVQDQGEDAVSVIRRLHGEGPEDEVDDTRVGLAEETDEEQARLDQARRERGEHAEEGGAGAEARGQSQRAQRRP